MSQDQASISHIDGVVDRVECIAARYRTHRFFPHFHDTYVIGVVTSGAALTSYRGEISEVRAGSVFVIEPGEVHAGEPVGGDGYAYVAFYPTVAEMEAAAGDAGARLHFEQLAYDDAELAERIVAVHRCASARPGVSHAGALSGVLRDLAARHGSPASAVTGTAHRAVRLAREHVDANFAKRVPLATLSAVSGMSTFHLIRVFRREVGLPPGMYLQLVRIRRATEMLRAGDAISHVAYAAGFSDQSHLTRRFRRIMGVTPGEYARRNRLVA